MTEKEPTSTKQKRQGILSFFQNPGKTDSNTSSIQDEQQSKDTVTIDSDTVDSIDVSESESESEESQKSTAMNSCAGQEQEEDEEEEEEEEEDDKKADDADFDATTSASQKEQARIEKATRKQQEKETRLRQKEELKIANARKRQEEKEERLKAKQERELKKQQEKEKRERKRAEERLERDKKKLQEKEEREKKRLLEKELKEQERIKKEEEKRKKEDAKEKAQSRIGNFFRKAPVSSSEQSVTTDFKKYFLPFYVKSDVLMHKNWSSETSRTKADVSRIDELMKKADISSTVDWLHSFKFDYGEEIELTAVEVLQTMTSKKKTEEELSELLNKVPQKFIKFYENIRPPYVGTFSRKLTLPRDNPFSTEDTGFDYGYDSDLDWINEEEDEEGGVDDLENDDDDDDDEQDEADEGDNEMDEFLDKDDETTTRTKFVGPLIPTIKLRSDLKKMDAESQDYFALVSVECLFEDLSFPVDPLKAPSKRPLTEEAQSTNVTSSNSSPTKKAKNLITDPIDLLKMLEQVHDCTFSLSTVTEIVQKHLPQYKKDTIKNSVKEYAAKSTKGNRKWQIKDVKKWEEWKRQSTSVESLVSLTQNP